MIIYSPIMIAYHSISALNVKVVTCIHMLKTNRNSNISLFKTVELPLYEKQSLKTIETTAIPGIASHVLQHLNGLKRDYVFTL